MEPMRDLPLGFGILLLQNPQASLAFSSMTDERRQEIIQRTHDISNKEDMRALVDSLAPRPMNSSPKPCEVNFDEISRFDRPAPERFPCSAVL